MRPTPIGVEVARALIARVMAADSSINRRDELWYASGPGALDRRYWHRRFAPADSLRIGGKPVTEWGRSAREAGASLQGRSSPEQRAASLTRVAAKRVAMVLDWAPVLGHCTALRSFPSYLRLHPHCPDKPRILIWGSSTYLPTGYLEHPGEWRPSYGSEKRSHRKSTPCTTTCNCTIGSYFKYKTQGPESATRTHSHLHGRASKRRPPKAPTHPHNIYAV